MQIQVNHDSSITGAEELNERVEGALGHALGRFSDRISRVEVHLSDVNGHKRGPDDKVCTLEARVQGLSPTAVSHSAPTVDEAVKGAGEKMKRALDSLFGRLADAR